MKPKISNFYYKSVKLIFINIVALYSLISCSSNNIFSSFIDNTKVVREKNTNSDIIKCPKVYLPKETINFKPSNKSKNYHLKIKKIELICKKLDKNSIEHTLVMDYKVYIELKSKNMSNIKKLLFPDIYIALINNDSEKILVKILSKINNKNTQFIKKSKNVVHKNKIKINYKNTFDNWIIYFGFQKILEKNNKLYMR